MLFVFAGKLVSVAQYDLPLAVFTAIGLGAAQGSGRGVIAGVTGHVLQVDGVGEVIADDRHDVLRGAVGGLDAGGGPVEPCADLVPATFVAAERAHDHHVIGVRPERLEGSGSSFDQVAQGLLAAGDETVPVAVHG